MMLTLEKLRLVWDEMVGNASVGIHFSLEGSGGMGGHILVAEDVREEFVLGVFI